jgi:glycosyltransferase involved in cell wall biosynthesis
LARVLYFSRDYTPHDHRFLSSLARTEHQVGYLRLERRGHTLEDRALPREIEQINWRGGRKPAQLLDSLPLLFDLRRVIDEFEPDLIQAGPIQRSAFLVALAGYRPLISTSWGYDLIHDAERNMLWRWATRFTLHRSSLMIGDCEPIRQLAISYGMHPERIVTFPWGIDLEAYRPPLERSTNGAFTLLSTRSWEPIYGVDVLAQAFSIAASQRPELRLVMLGNGSQAPLLHNIFQRGGVADRVNTPGQVPQRELPNYFRRTDLYISASHSDGTSISLLEALASGLPAIVSDIPGNREWIRPEENGWWFPDGDAQALAETILIAFDRRESLREMGERSREIAERGADWNKNFQTLLGAYERVLANE